MSDLVNGFMNLTKQVTTNLTSNYEIRKVTEKMQSYIMNYTEAESMVREATNEDPWGPTTPQMKDICNYTFQYEEFYQATEMLWKRMFEDNKSAWRRVYKSLKLLEHLLHNGSERMINNAKDHLFQLRSLEHYKFTDEKGKDQGINIRHRVGIIIELLQDEEKLRDARKKIKNESRDKYQGFTADEMRMGRGPRSNDSWKKNNDDWKNKNDDWKNTKDDWSSKKEDKFESYSNKEVNAFQFPDSGSRNSESPELGFKQEQEDDGFGEFTKNRTTTPTPAFADFSKAPVTSSKPQSSAAPDLLGLDDPFPSGNVSAPVTVDVKIPQPPSGPSSPNFSQPVHRPASNNQSFDPFGGSDLLGGGAPAVNSAASFEPSWDSMLAAKPAQDSFADFGAFQQSASPVAPVTAATNNDFDIFASAPVMTPSNPAPIAQTSSGLDDFFTSPTLASTTLSPTNTSLNNGNSMGMNPSPTPKPVNANVKLGNTWAGTGLIDLDNLVSKPAPKANLTLNQMQSKQSGTGSFF